VRIVTLPEHSREDGSVVVAEGERHVPYPIARMFLLRGPLGARRGDHAHKLCWQFFVCVSGAVDVTCDDVAGKNTFSLSRASEALLVPPTIWTTVLFQKPDSSVVVLCDRVYEADDYLHERDEFLAFRKCKQP
jgi:hypothetical protein